MHLYQMQFMIRLRLKNINSCSIQLFMYSNPRINWSINHSLTPQLQQLPTYIQQYEIPSLPKKHSQPYKIPKTINPLTQRSRKHRLLEQRNTQIQKTNRLLYEKIRKIKLKNMYHSQKKIEPQIQDDSVNMNNDFSKNYMFPQINDNKKSVKTSTTLSNKMLSMNSTKSHLNNILQDRTTFVQKYFIDLKQRKAKKLPDKQMGTFVTETGWKVKVLLVDDQNLLLVGKKGRKQLTKKYLYSKVKQKMQNGLEQWVKYKFSFQN